VLVLRNFSELFRWSKKISTWLFFNHTPGGRRRESAEWRARPIALVDPSSLDAAMAAARSLACFVAHLRRRHGVCWALHHPSVRSVGQFDVRILGMSRAALHSDALGGFLKIVLRVFLPRVSTATWSAGGLGCHKGIHEEGRVERS